jgi:hypothetical protein
MEGEQQDDDVVHQALEAYVAAFAAARAEHQPGVDFASANARLIQDQTGRFMNC